MADWIEGFLAYTSRKNSPDLFRKWAAIATLAGVAERKIWIKNAIGILYPNLYLAFIGGPAVGKSVMLRETYTFWRTVKDLKIAPTSITSASLIDALDQAKRQIVRPKDVPSVVTFNSLQVAVPEFGVFLPAYDNEFMSNLTHFYDCEPYSQTRRTRGTSIEIKNPQLNILACGTPNYLMNTLPEGAWDQGFTSRFIMLYSGESRSVDIFEELEEEQEVFEVLKRELSERADRFGRLLFTEAAINSIRNWVRQGEQPKPNHPKLVSYNGRRIAHLLKLSMIANLSENTDEIITLEHVERALDWLIEAEFYMPDIFRAMSGSSHAQLIDETWHFIFTAYHKGKKEPVSASRVINFLQARTPAHNVTRVLEVMEQSGVIKRRLVATGNAYEPQGRDL